MHSAKLSAAGTRADRYGRSRRIEARILKPGSVMTPDQGRQLMVFSRKRVLSSRLPVVRLHGGTCTSSSAVTKRLGGLAHVARLSSAMMRIAPSQTNETLAAVRSTLDSVQAGRALSAIRLSTATHAPTTAAAFSCRPSSLLRRGELAVFRFICMNRRAGVAVLRNSSHSYLRPLGHTAGMSCVPAWPIGAARD